MRRMYDLGNSHLLGLGVLLPQAPCALVFGLTILPNAQSMSAGWPSDYRWCGPCTLPASKCCLVWPGQRGWIMFVNGIARQSLATTSMGLPLLTLHLLQLWLKFTKVMRPPTLANRVQPLGKPKVVKLRRRLMRNQPLQRLKQVGMIRRNQPPRKHPESARLHLPQPLGNQVVVVRMLARESDDQDPRPKPIRSQ